MPTKFRFLLSSAFTIACSRLENVEGCGELFSELGADGLERLAAAVYQMRSDVEEVSICRRRMGAAFTEVGGRHVSLCDDFVRLARSEAAVRLIHEALHHAGMPERPADPEALSSDEINQLVRERCEL